MIKGIRKSRIIISFIMILVVALAGTYAWLRYQSVRSRMVLTIGNINDVMVTLAPYEFNGGLSPVSTYTGATTNYTYSYTLSGEEVTITGKSGNVVEITASNNRGTPSSITFNYHINEIDSSLAISDLMYTVVDGSSSVASGNFSGKVAGNEATIYSFNLAAGATKNYKIYLWLRSNGNQTNLIGKKIDITFGATIPHIHLCFDLNGDGDVDNDDVQSLLSQYSNGSGTITYNGKTIVVPDLNGDGAYSAEELGTVVDIKSYCDD